VELVKEIFVNIQAFLATQQSQGQMDALLVETKQILPVTPTRYGLCVVVQSEDTFEVFEQSKPPVLIMTKS
jgi:hypothetical protein